MGSNAEPPSDGVYRAGELWELHYSLRQIAEILRSENFQCGSPQTASNWIDRYNAAKDYVRARNRGESRARMLGGLEHDMGRLRLLLDSGGIDTDTAYKHFKWLYRELARVQGTDDVTVNVNDTRDQPGKAPADDLVELVDNSVREADAETAARRNGAHP